MSERATHDRLPPELAGLLSATDEAAANYAWDRFLESYGRLLLHTARSTAKNREAAMDGYAYVLERLREDEFRRLHAYSAEGRAKFSTWLVVVARRLVLDHRRSRYGRDRGDDAFSGQDRLEARRRLADLVSEVADIDALPDSTSGDHGRDLRLSERRDILVQALTELEAPDQLLLNLRFVDGLSGREIAEMMGLPSLFHAYRRLHSALAVLRTKLEARGIDDAEP